MSPDGYSHLDVAMLALPLDLKLGIRSSECIEGFIKIVGEQKCRDDHDGDDGGGCAGCAVECTETRDSCYGGKGEGRQIGRWERVALGWTEFGPLTEMMFF